MDARMRRPQDALEPPTYGAIESPAYSQTL
jgi:hypothetical protein